ncbi:MAG TPA: MerR family transcriptional regulator [Firmicutes bacterium]|nr:MerR family transcriptional regulator [Bacillota bacterium]
MTIKTEKNFLTIGEAAKSAGIGVETVRFYERQGLIDDPPRSDSGYRLYPEEIIHRLRFIRRAKELGFSLREIRELISLKYEKDSVIKCDGIRQMTESKINMVNEKIAALHKLQSDLIELLDACCGKGEMNNCPVLKVLENGDEKIEIL